MKKNKFSLYIPFLLAFLFVVYSQVVSAQEIFIASGAGYKKPLTEIITVFEKQSGIHVNAIYGNLNAVITQASQTDDISCIVGDKKFLAKMGSSLKFESFQTIGNGVLVLAWRKGIELDALTDIQTSKVESVFMPNRTKAIYGVAAMEYIEREELHSQFEDKLIEVATVPQVVAYLLTGEVDAGFINMTEALANKEKLGGYLLVPEDKYTEIIITAGIVDGFQEKKSTKEFLSFLASEEAKSIFIKYGLY
jgi:molybdate transport system substrate-binding protein